MGYHLELRWTVSRSTGYNICGLWVDGVKVSSCDGGGYDMEGTALGNWIASAFAKELNKSIVREFHGLWFVCPEYYKEDVKAALETDEIQGGGLATYQAQFARSSKVPTKNHTIPQIDGACGMDSVLKIVNAIGYEIDWAPQGRRKNSTIGFMSKAA